MPIPSSPELADLILRTARRLRSAHAAALEGLPVNPHQAHALRAIARLEPARPSQIAGRLRVARGSATEVIDTLVAGGWVARTPDPSDGRATLLTLTDEGRALLDQVTLARNQGAELILGGLPDDERSALAATLSLVAPRPDSVHESPPPR